MTFRHLCAATTLANCLAIASAAPASAQVPSPVAQSAGAVMSKPARSIWRDLFTDSIHDVRQFPSRDTYAWLIFGTAAAMATREVADASVGRSLAEATQLREPLEPGAVLGSTPVQLGASAAAYVIGRATSSPRMTAVSADLFRAQLMSQGMAMGLKYTFRRERPDGSPLAFPSGHTTVSFASATVLQRHFGWKIGVPSYALASYVAVSRVQMQRHYVSDVAFGAALGIAIGRTVTIGRAKLEVSPMPGATGVQFTWRGRGFNSDAPVPVWRR